METTRVNETSSSCEAAPETATKQFEVRRQAQTMTTADYVAIIDTHREAAEAILPEAVKTPDRPMPIFIREGTSVVNAARRHQKELCAVGLQMDRVQRLEDLLVVADAAQVLLHIETGEAEFDRVLTVVGPARELRDWMIAASELALRDHQEGLARLSVIKELKEQNELGPSLTELAVLAADHRSEFEEKVCMDVDDVARRLHAAAEGVRTSLLDAGAARYLPNTRELRDRIYTLALGPLGEIRAYAAFAFRSAAESKKRASFTSSYLRDRNRKARSKKKAAPQPAGVTAAPATVPGTVVPIQRAAVSPPASANPPEEILIARVG